jgi:assimilatory nitrate reductase catalytic subunit
VTDVVRPDTIFAPFHWSGRSNVNAMTNPVLDRFSKMPAFKVCAVTLRRIGPSDDDPSAESPAVENLSAEPTELARDPVRSRSRPSAVDPDRRDIDLKE